MGITAFPFGSVIDVPTARILGRDDAGTGSAEALTNTEIFAILGTGTPSASTYLRGDGTWSTVSAGISSLNGLTDATQTFAVGTTVPGPAGRVWAIVAGIAQILGGDQSATIDSFYALDGGRPYKSLTAAAFAQQRADAERLSAADAYFATVMNEHIAPVASDPARTVDSIRAAFLQAVGP